MKKYKPRDKVTQKMTQDGATEQNQFTGESENISGREKQQNFSRSLHFSEEELANPELQKYIRKSEKAADKLEAAQENIPTKKKLTRKRTFDEAAQKSKSKLCFEEVEKPIPKGGKKNLAAKAAGGVGSTIHQKVHGKVYEVEKENSGVEAGHGVERAGEKVLSTGRKTAKHAVRNHRLKPYRELAAAEKAAMKADTNFLYRKTLSENPNIAGNPLSRFWQKQRIKRNYAKDLRAAQKTAQKTGSASKVAAKKTAEATEKTTAFVARHWKGGLAIGLVAMLVMILMGGVASCSNMMIGGLSTVAASTYPSEETEMTAVEAAYSGKEQSLQYKLDHYEEQNPGYDEYRYQLDGIFHNAHQLAAYLSAKYEDYTLSEVQAELERLFGLQYKLTEKVTTETRYRTETRTDTWTDEDGETHSDTYTVQVPYTYYIMTVTLKNNGLASILPSQLTPQQLEMYNIYCETSGNMPLLFGGGSIDGSPSTDLSGVQFVNGTRPGNTAIVELAKAQVGNVGGQPYWSWYGFNGRVEWCACFVSWCLNQSGYSEPKFAACTSQGVPWFRGHGQWASGNYTDLAPGDIIFFDWDGSGDADHVGIVIGKDDTIVYTVEGNSGDACKIRSYPLTSQYIYGYGLMNW